MVFPHLYLPFLISGMLLDSLPNTSVVQVLSVFCILVLCTPTLALCYVFSGVRVVSCIFLDVAVDSAILLVNINIILSNEFALSIYSLSKLDCSSKLSSDMLRAVTTFFLMGAVNAVSFHLPSLILPMASASNTVCILITHRDVEKKK